MADPDVNGPIAPQDRELRALLGDAHTIAVVGLSSNIERPSNGVAEYLQARGYRIVPVNPKETEVLGERAYARSAPSPPISGWTWSTSSVAPRTRRTSRDAVEIGARVLWLQAGIVNDEAYRIATEAGLEVIMGVCIRSTIRRLDTTEG